MRPKICDGCDHASYDDNSWYPEVYFCNYHDEYIDEIEAKGGTNINEALLEALQMDYKRNRPLSIVFITDGLPTVGETDIGKIITNVSEKNKNHIKVFTFGVGYDVNTVLLDKIASFA